MHTAWTAYNAALLHPGPFPRPQLVVSVYGLDGGFG